MQKTLLAALVAVSSLASAHELWVSAPDRITTDDVLKADLGYSDYFPTLEAIPGERVQIFKPLAIHGTDGKTQDMNQKGENYQYEAKEKLAVGNYWLSAVYQPTFWSKNKDGWKQQNLTEMPDASTCQQAQMFGKKLLVVGDGAVDVAAISKPIGQNLEIVPLADPTQAKVDERFPVQIYYEGKPLAGATVIATSDTFMAKDLDATRDERPPQAFSGKTDKDGKVSIIPQLEGLWKIKVAHKAPFEDQKTCLEHSNTATLLLPIGTKRAENLYQ